MGTTNSSISIERYVYTPYAAAGMLLHINGGYYDFLMKTIPGYILSYFFGVLTGILIMSFGFSILYIRWRKRQSSRKENTYLNLDLSVDNEEKRYNYAKRDSIAFVREISSVDNCSTVNEKGRTGRIKRRLNPWYPPKYWKRIFNGKSNLNKDPETNRKLSPIKDPCSKESFSYELPVTVEIPYYIDFEPLSPCVGTLEYSQELLKCELQKTNKIQEKRHENGEEDGDCLELDECTTD